MFLHILPIQEDDLRQIFMLTVEVLQEFSRRENLNAQMSSVFQRYLALANQVLSWNFLPPNYILFRFASLCENDCLTLMSNLVENNVSLNSLLLLLLCYYLS